MYTKGEWRFTDGGTHLWIESVEVEHVIAMVWEFNWRSVYPKDEAEANARLIAKSPIMYEAIKLYLRHQQNTHGLYCSQCHSELEKAIADV